VRVLLSTYDSRGGVEPLIGLAVRLRELGAEAPMCAPPDCAERLAEVGRIRADGATAAATLLPDGASQENPSAPTGVMR
jgi:UDP:flavonoid glycosyltransferase YjiC (YdhE family)